MKFCILMFCMQSICTLLCGIHLILLFILDDGKCVCSIDTNFSIRPNLFFYKQLRYISRCKYTCMSNSAFLYFYLYFYWQVTLLTHAETLGNLFRILGFGIWVNAGRWPFYHSELQSVPFWNIRSRALKIIKNNPDKKFMIKLGNGEKRRYPPHSVEKFPQLSIIRTFF